MHPGLAHHPVPSTWRRRQWLAAAVAAWPGAALLAQDEPRPQLKISAAQLYHKLSDRFPARFGLGGLLRLELRAPRLHLLPARNQLGATLQAQLGGPAVQPVEPGELDVAFGLRYEAADRTLRALQPDILDVRLPGLVPEMVAWVKGVLPGVAREVVGELVVHAFTPQELALPDTMGLEPSRLTVVEDGLLVVFADKPRR
ncbi:MAG TPA: DUF1439 domain-containing protein [Ramlibacter sp.]|jgi:hypothetical protein|uniref:DUF1439 domain-containing protein n=1 Tax=Ramlibacter sp. TaxID=1917967 RepID=UPI002D6C1256|nr:DUF1439 domain-containing protein [Ramlibacter sp.]HZY18119.1 DUF1439 domain-containing protein [Ramlibacter sp.]